MAVRVPMSRFLEVKSLFFNEPNPFMLTEKGKLALWQELIKSDNWEKFVHSDPFGVIDIDWYGLEGWDAEEAYCHMNDC